MSKEYHTIYKCRMCGETFVGSRHSNVDVEIVARHIEPVEGMWALHRCADGSCGNADFIGIRKVGGEE